MTLSLLELDVTAARNVGEIFCSICVLIVGCLYITSHKTAPARESEEQVRRGTKAPGKEVVKLVAILNMSGLGHETVQFYNSNDVFNPDSKSFILSKPNVTQLNSTQSKSKATSLR